MNTVRGKLVRLDLGGGGWELRTPRGSYTLAGPVPEKLEGAEVVVEGVLEEVASFLMTGDPVLVVTKVTPA